MSLQARSLQGRAMCAECGERQALVMMTTIRPRDKRVVEVRKVVRLKHHSLCARCYRDLQNSTLGRA